MSDPKIKQLKIKTGVVKRLTKEKGCYEKEITAQTKRVEKMKQEKRDSHDIRKQEEVLQESQMMIPDCLRRLKTAVDDLSNLMRDEKDLKEAEEFSEAESALKAARDVLK